MRIKMDKEFQKLIPPISAEKCQELNVKLIII